MIANDDNPPLLVTGIRASGLVQQIVFLAQAGRDYRIAYGSASTPAPKYEADTILAKLMTAGAPVVATLGAAVETPGFQEQPATPRRLLDNWYFLGSMIALMVVVLGWSLFRAGARLNDLPKS